MDKVKCFKLADKRRFSAMCVSGIADVDYLEPVFVGPAKELRFLLEIHDLGHHDFNNLPTQVTQPGLLVETSHKHKEDSSWQPVYADVGWPDPTINPSSITFPALYEFRRQDKGAQIYPWIRTQVSIIRQNWSHSINGYITYSVTLIAEYD